MRLVVFVAIIVFFAFFVRAALAGIEKSRQDRQRWKLCEHSDGSGLIVSLEHPGDVSLTVRAEYEEGEWIDRADFAEEDFDYRIALLRSEGQAKVHALNGGKAIRS